MAVLPSRSGEDLASRVFNNAWFAAAWVVFLAVVLFRFWWIRDAVLVCWRYGRDAWVHGAVRVLPGKPVRFSTGELVGRGPDMATGAAFFSAVTFGLSLLLIAGLRIYERVRRRSRTG